MKRTLVKLGLTVGLSTTLLGYTYQINEGWQQLGAIQDTNLSIFDNQCIDYLWYYDNSDNSNPQWKLHISNGTDYGYCGETIDSVLKGQGFWAKANGDCNITIADTSSCQDDNCTEEMPAPPNIENPECYTCDSNVSSGNVSYDGVNNTSEESAIPALNDFTNGMITVTASSTLSAYHAWYAFDNENSSLWETTLYMAPEWLMVDFSDNKIINKYQLMPYSADVSGAPKNWILQGSNDNVNWINLDNRENETAWQAYTFNTYTFINSTPYRYYRLYVLEENGRGYLDIVEFKLIEAQ